MNASNEGHGYRKKENRDVMNQAVLLFLKPVSHRVAVNHHQTYPYRSVPGPPSVATGPHLKSFS